MGSTITIHIDANMLALIAQTAPLAFLAGCVIAIFLVPILFILSLYKKQVR